MYQTAQKAAFCEAFSKRTGATVIQDGPVDYAKYRIMVQSGHPVWDVVDVTIEFLYANAPDGMFEKIDTGVVDTGRFEQRYLHPFGAPAIVWSYNLCYSTQTYDGAAKPSTWADLFDLKKYPGRRALRDRAVPMMEVALLADGVPADALYPIDMDRAFRKLDTVKQDSVFWTTNSQSQQLLVDNDAVMGIMTNGRAADAMKKGGKLDLSWKQHLQSADYLVVSKGSQNRDAAMALIAEMTTPDAQAAIANLAFSSPTVPAAFPMVKEEIKPFLPTNPAYAKDGLLVDQNYWRDHLHEADERWTKWKLG